VGLGPDTRVILVAALAMVGTLPGRTQGLGLITEPLLADLHLDRVDYAALNFWATILGAGGAIGVGRLIDRYGGRAILTAVAIALGLVVTAMSQVAAFAALAICVTLTRGLGQSALSVVSLTLIGKGIASRLDRAMAIYSVVLSIGFMIAFPVVGALVQASGWRVAWLAVGFGVLALVAPAAGVLPRMERPVLRPAEQDPASLKTGRSVESGRSIGEALRSGAFWVFAIGTALYGLVASGIGLFNESVLAERGFGADVYYQTLVVTAMTGLGGNFLGGWLAQRVRLTTLLAWSLLTLAAGLIALPHVATMTQVMLWAVAMGLGGGLVMVLFFTVWPKAFGQAHLGRIQGAAQALTVFASALGPLLLAWCVDSTGSYTAMFRILAAIVAATALSALTVRLP
jgi:MFS family permease